MPFYTYFCLIAHAWLLCACILPLNLPFGTHVLVFNGNTGHLPQFDARLDVSELQTQVFPPDGHPGSALSRPRLRE